ncbi:Os02g0607850 [Oryza sativa Japonica Group]|uniref:Os02g0607850 protein n=2 Tax=Oryza sativa subsp. japonica TaxID=39947 RepID=Q6K1Y7_ORYSJ|nr:hypothetical protein [Oryza sativa Japonica Group]BAS79679.1 Os02g0607850 [Oryza sativa Japonica Group]
MPHCPDSLTLRRGDEPTTEHPGATSPTGAANHLHHQHWAPAPQSRPGSSPDAATTKHAGGIRQPPASPSASRVVTRISRATCRRHTRQTSPSRAAPPLGLPSAPCHLLVPETGCRRGCGPAAAIPAGRAVSGGALRRRRGGGEEERVAAAEC